MMVTVKAENLNATLHSLSVKIARWWGAVFRDLDLHDLLSLDPGPSQLLVAHCKRRKAGRGLRNKATYMYMYFTYKRVFKVRTCTFSKVAGQNPTGQNPTGQTVPLQCYI